MSLDTIAIWAESAAYGGEPIMGSSSAPSGLPWPLDRDDLIHFRAQSRNRVLVMGRGTYEKLPEHMKQPQSTWERPLIVLTHTRLELDVTNIVAGTFESPEDLRAFARAWYPDKGIAVIGGPTVIEWAEPILDTLDVTIMRGRYHGDVRAPSEAFMEQFKHEKVTGVTGSRVVTRYDREVPTPQELELAL